MINILRNSISCDSQLAGMHETILKRGNNPSDFGTILSNYLCDYIRQTIESNYNGFMQDKERKHVN